MSHLSAKIYRYPVSLLLTIFLGLLAAGAAGAQGLAEARFDLTENGVVDEADAAVVVGAMARLQQEGRCLSPETAAYDLNGDGCINVFDVQLILAYWGERTRPQPELPPLAAAAEVVFTVNSTSDASDNNPGDGVCNAGSNRCTLRAALVEANSRSGPEIIRFEPDSCSNRMTFRPGSPLVIDAPDDSPIVIDGYSHCGARANSDATTGNAEIKVEIEGSGDGIGLGIYSANNTVKGLAIYKFFDNVLLYTSNAHHNTIQGNFIGSNAALSYYATGYGVNIKQGAWGNLIGGDQSHERNIVTGFGQEGIAISGRGKVVYFNIVTGNYVGLKQDGRTPGNQNGDGIDISNGAMYNWIGASPPPGWALPANLGDPTPPPNPAFFKPQERNVVGGNDDNDGVELSHFEETQYNYVVNNYIGLDATGTRDVGNGKQGVTFEDKVNHNYVYNNVIANNGANGVRLYGMSHTNQVVNNYIGVGPNGSTPMGNGQDPDEPDGPNGIYIFGGSQHNLIQNNIIANHPGHGVLLTKQESYLGYSRETHYNTISQNSIYNNGAGIRLAQHSTGLPNKGLKAPEIRIVNQGAAAGKACSACIVELFVAATNDGNDNEGGEGKKFLNRGTADNNGNFLVPISGAALGEKVTATATDGSGNTSEFGRNLEVKQGSPPAGEVLVNGGAGSHSAYTTVLAQFSAEDDLGITGMRYTVDNPNIGGQAWQAVTPTPAYASEQVLTLGQGAHTVYAQYRDGEGKTSPVYSAGITITPLGNPTTPAASVVINNGAQYTNKPGLTLQLISSLYAKEMEVGDSSGDLDGDNWEPYLTQRSWSLVDPDNGSKSKTTSIYARFRDAKSATTAIVKDDILYDPVPPTAGVKLNHATRRFDLSGSADDPGGSGLGAMRFYNGQYDTGWIPFQSSAGWYGPDNATISVQVRDRAGNVSAAVPLALPQGWSSGSTYLPVIIR